MWNFPTLLASERRQLFARWTLASVLQPPRDQQSQKQKCSFILQDHNLYWPRAYSELLLPSSADGLLHHEIVETVAFPNPRPTLSLIRRCYSCYILPNFISSTVSYIFMQFYSYDFSRKFYNESFYLRGENISKYWL